MDELDQHDSEDDNPSSSLALSYKSIASTIEPIKNSQNITKTLINHQQNPQYKKTRPITPETSFENYDLLTTNRLNSKKQRSLTPENRPITPELTKKYSKLTTSQTSINSRQNSRNSTLERQSNQYERGHLSRSSSSSSEADTSNRRLAHRPPFKTSFGEYRIRRSR